MNKIEINSPTDYFSLTYNQGQDVWVFTFRWNESYGLFHVDLTLNNEPFIYSVAVVGGRFILKDFSRGYNFLLMGTVSQVSDLGTKMNLYSLTTAETQELGLI